MAGRTPQSIEDVLDVALSLPTPRIHAYVDALRRKNPDASPAQIIGLLEKRYLLAVGASGGAVGAAAALPVVGTGAALALTAGQVGTFLAASAALALAIADVHGIAVEDPARRRALLLTALLGEKGPQLLEEQLGLSTITWGRTLLTRMPVATVRSVNRHLRKRVLTGTAGRAGTVLLGRLLPFGIGAVVGFQGARMMGGAMITGVHAAFGAPPAQFTRRVEGAFTVIEDLFDPPALQAGPGRPGA